MCIVEQVLAAYLRPAVRVRVVALAKYARVRQVVREEVAQLVNAVACYLCSLAVSVKAVYSDNARVRLAVRATH